MERIKTDLLVIGAGPGGYEAAIYAAKCGLEVVIAEKGHIGGTCLNVGCIPTKAFVKMAEVYETVRNAAAFGIQTCGEPSVDMESAVHIRNRVTDALRGGVEYLLQENRIRLLQGTACFVDAKTVRVDRGSKDTLAEITAKNILIATGSAAVELAVPGMDLPQVINSTAALSDTTLPAHIVIIGAGVIGMEFAFLYNRLGTQVQVVELQDRILPNVDPDAARILVREAKRRGIRLHTSTRVVEVRGTEDEKACIVCINKEGEHQLVADKVLTAVGRTPFYEGLHPEKAGIRLEKDGRGIPVDEYMRTNVDHIYAIGDVNNQFQLAHAASHQGFAAVDHICGREEVFDTKKIPDVIFTSPEIASVGLGEEEVKQLAEAGCLEYSIMKFPFSANGKALTMQETEGFVKLLANRSDGSFLGGSIVGPDASALIGILSLALSARLSVLEIAQTVFAHPTTAEAIGEAAMGFGKGMINI